MKCWIAQFNSKEFNVNESKTKKKGNIELTEIRYISHFLEFKRNKTFTGYAVCTPSDAGH